MKKKIDLSVALFMVFAAIVSTFTISYIFFSGEWTVKRHMSASSPVYKVAEAIGIIEDNFVGDFDEDKIIDGAIDGMVQSLEDRWSYYMSAEEVSSYYMNMNNQYSGVGIVIEQTDSGVIVSKVYKNSPAMEAGVLAGSIITAVDGADCTGMEMYEVREVITASMNANGMVTISLLDSEKTEYEVQLTPRVIELDPVEYSMIEDNIGLITVSNFEAKAAEQMQSAAEELISNGAKGIIFDVRSNPGGQLSELLQAMDFVLPEGVVFVSKSKGEEPQYKTSDPSCIEIPIAVLVNADTYSAAEFFAAALSEYNRAVVIGAQTTGKGYAQVTIPMSDGSAVHISSREYFTPNGRSLAGVGLTPDKEVLLDEQKQLMLYYGKLSPEEDDQLLAAVEYLNSES